MAQVLTGEWGNPVNTAAHQKGGIHDDNTATELGFSGGTVAGSIHMEQFLPLLLDTFGDSWWETGILSMYFLQATMDRQSVRCYLSLEPSGQAQVWMENEAGDKIMQGTAQLGDCTAPTALRTRLDSQRAPGELRILKEFSEGLTVEADTQVAPTFVDHQLSVITENHNYFTNPDVFGQRVLPYTQVVRAFDAAEQLAAQPAINPFVGLYGGIEIGYLNGPGLEATNYQSTCEVVGLGDSPKTEILWRESKLFLDGKPIAQMLKMDRLMKNSSPLWD